MARGCGPAPAACHGDLRPPTAGLPTSSNDSAHREQYQADSMSTAQSGQQARPHVGQSRASKRYGILAPQTHKSTMAPPHDVVLTMIVVGGGLPTHQRIHRMFTPAGRNVFTKQTRSARGWRAEPLRSPRITWMQSSTPAPRIARQRTSPTPAPSGHSA